MTLSTLKKITNITQDSQVPYLLNRIKNVFVEAGILIELTKEVKLEIIDTFLNSGCEKLLAYNKKVVNEFLLLNPTLQIQDPIATPLKVLPPKKSSAFQQKCYDAAEYNLDNMDLPIDIESFDLKTISSALPNAIEKARHGSTVMKRLITKQDQIDYLASRISQLCIKDK